MSLKKFVSYVSEGNLEVKLLAEFRQAHVFARHTLAGLFCFSVLISVSMLQYLTSVSLLNMLFSCRNRLVGLLVKASASGAEDPGFESRLRRHFSGSSHTSDFKIGTPVATLPGAWHYRVSAGTGWSSVSIL